MSTYQTLKAMRLELKKLNQMIDIKIIKGLPYKIEARRHKFLMAQISRLTTRTVDIFGRTFGFASFI